VAAAVWAASRGMLQHDLPTMQAAGRTDWVRHRRAPLPHRGQGAAVAGACVLGVSHLYILCMYVCVSDGGAPQNTIRLLIVPLNRAAAPSQRAC
jgi:hypothetical protein